MFTGSAKMHDFGVYPRISTLYLNFIENVITTKFVILKISFNADFAMKRKNFDPQTQSFLN